MAVLQQLGYSQAYFNSFLDMNPYRAIKKEERKSCLFDLDDFVNFPGDFPSANVKSEQAPPFCRLATPYGQPYSFGAFGATRPGPYQDPYLYCECISAFFS